MRHHPHCPDWVYVLIAGAIATLIIAACMTAATAKVTKAQRSHVAGNTHLTDEPPF